MEGAGEGRLVAGLEACQLGAAVRAGVDEAVQLAGAVARDHHRLAADVGGVVVAVVRDLALVRQVDPVALEDVLHLELEQLRIVEGGTLDAVQAFVVVIDQHAVQALAQVLLAHVGSPVCLWGGRQAEPVRERGPVPDHAAASCAAAGAIWAGQLTAVAVPAVCLAFHASCGSRRRSTVCFPCDATGCFRLPPPRACLFSGGDLMEKA